MQHGLTLRRLLVWTYDPRERLQMLAVLVEGCKREHGRGEGRAAFHMFVAGLKGGALVSTLYHYSQHGDPAVRKLVKHLLTQVPPPLHACAGATTPPCMCRCHHPSMHTPPSHVCAPLHVYRCTSLSITCSIVGCLMEYLLTVHSNSLWRVMTHQNLIKCGDQNTLCDSQCCLASSPQDWLRRCVGVAVGVMSRCGYWGDKWVWLLG